MNVAIVGGTGDEGFGLALRFARAGQGVVIGSRVADREGWTAEHNWWYFAVPREPGPLLREDLEGAD